MTTINEVARVYHRAWRRSDRGARLGHNLLINLLGAREKRQLVCSWAVEPVETALSTVRQSADEKSGSVVRTVKTRLIRIV